MNKTALILVLSIFWFSQLYSQQFTGSFNLVVSQQYENGNERGDTLSYFFGKDKTALIIHAKRNQPDLRLVFNTKDSTITGLFEQNGRKGGYILPMNEKYWPGMQIATRDYGTGPRTELNYTGKTKEVEGYETREILAENDEYTASLWIPEAIELNMGSVLAYQSVGAGKDANEVQLFDQFGVEGLPLELILESKKDRGDVIIRVQNISKEIDKSIFSTEGHTLSKIDN